jgi:P-type Ca2+ transporter type 2C
MTNSPKKQFWHALTIEQAIAALDTNPELGLEPWQISDRQAAYGRNELNTKSGRSKHFC